jgi:DNA-binding LacI/PurR family transcriptional regulator
MITTVKDSRTSLYIQLKSELIDRIKTGKIPVGSKMISERMLAEKTGVSRSTAKQALLELEADGYIERIPAKGSFVKDISDGKLKQTNIILPFPEKSLSRVYLRYANWVAANELYRGMMASCGIYNTRITFQYFEDTGEKGIIQKQVKDIQDFDGAIFIGWQMLGLRRELEKQRVPLITFHSEIPPNDPGPCFTYNHNDIIRQSAEFIVDCGYRKVGMIYCGRTSNDKREISEKVFVPSGVEFDPRWIIIADDTEENAYQELKKRIPDNLKEIPEIFFCGSPVYVFALMRLANERNWNIPDDISIFGYACDMSVRPTNPPLTYVYVPYYEMGLAACRALAENINEKVIVPAKIIKGKTTKRI